jgi:hypothetical protein
MKHVSKLILLCGLVLILVSGCAPVQRDNTDVLYLAGVDGGNAFYRHFERWEGEEWTRSSLWSVNLQSGQCRRITEARRFQGLVAEGNYYVFDKYDSPPNAGERLWGVQISTEEEFEILTGASGLGHYGSYGLVGTRLVVLDGAELVHYDMAERAVVDAFPVPVGTWYLLDMHEDLVLLQGVEEGYEFPTEGGFQSEDELPDSWLALLDLTDGTVTQIPPYSDSWSFPPIDAKMATGWVVTSGPSMDTEEKSDYVVWGYNISSGDWKVLAEYESDAAGPLLLGMSLLNLVTGVNEDYALVERVTLGLSWDRAVVELIDLESGERSEIGDVRGEMLIFTSLRTILTEDKAYWIDPMNRELVIHDLATGTKRTLDLEYPGS